MLASSLLSASPLWIHCSRPVCCDRLVPIHVLLILLLNDFVLISFASPARIVFPTQLLEQSARGFLLSRHMLHGECLHSFSFASWAGVVLWGSALNLAASSASGSHTETQETGNHQGLRGKLIALEIRIDLQS